MYKYFEMLVPHIYRGMVHTNGIESFWSMLKRAYVGTYHKLSPKHLNRYVQEFAGKHNIRDLGLGYVGADDRRCCRACRATIHVPRSCRAEWSFVHRAVDGNGRNSARATSSGVASESRGLTVLIWRIFISPARFLAA